MHKTTLTTEELYNAKQKLMEMFREELNEDKTVVGCNIEKIGELADMIKDLSEAEKECMEKKYYEMLICNLMQEDESMNEVGRMGYDHYHYANGKFASKGHGHRVGYMPVPHMSPDENPSNSGPYWYNPGVGMERMGYSEMDPRRMENVHHSKYGVGYDEYKERKMHYSQSHDEKTHHDMEEKIEEATYDALDALREMWTDAKPETRRKLTADVAAFLEEMKRMQK